MYLIWVNVMSEEFTIRKISKDFYSIGKWKDGKLTYVFAKPYKDCLAKAKKLGIDFHKHLIKDIVMSKETRIPTSSLIPNKKPEKVLNRTFYKIRKGLQDYMD
jgi:hypothetical protein